MYVLRKCYEYIYESYENLLFGSFNDFKIMKHPSSLSFRVFWGVQGRRYFILLFYV